MRTYVPSRRKGHFLAIVSLLLFSLATPDAPGSPKLLRPGIVFAQGNNYLVNTVRDGDNNVGNASANRVDCAEAYAGTLDPLKDCTLREAIIAANTDSGSSQIVFDIPLDEAVEPLASLPYWSIQIGENLPRLTENGTWINGLTQTGADAQKPRVELNSLLASAVEGAFATGLRIASSNNIVEGMIINNAGGNVTLNRGTGVLIEPFGGSSPVSNTIRYNYIGTDESGTQSRRNGNAGIQINNSSGNTVLGNVIAGNGLNGLLLTSAISNTIIGNYIGINRQGSQVANDGYGIALSSGSRDNRIGDQTPSQRNIISGNKFSGVIIFDGSNNNTLENNYIGLSNLGSASVPNGTPITGTNTITITYAGVEIRDSAANNIIGGPGINRRNFISGNDGPGILIADAGTVSNTIAGNVIGQPAFGTASTPNNGSGVLIARQANDNLVGSTDATRRNVIAGNLRYGVEISSTSLVDPFPVLNGVQILSNTIGTSTISNALGGILIGNNVRSVQIGNGNSAGSNLIGGNGGPGISIIGTNVLTANIISNTIGLNNRGPGISIAGTVTATTIVDNDIWNNQGAGILLSNSALVSTVFTPTIRGNRIGTVADSSQQFGLRDFRNTGPGIQSTGAALGIQVLSNTLAFNQGGGIALSGAFTPTVQGNTVSYHQQTATSSGVLLDGGTLSATVRSNQVLSNAIGVQLNGAFYAQVLTNTIRFNSSANGTGIDINGGAQHSRVLTNTIERNGGSIGPAIRISGSGTDFNSVQSNVMLFNGGSYGGLDLVGSANENIAPPVISYFDRGFNVIGNVGSSCGGLSCTIELYTPFISPTGEVDDDAYRFLQRATVGASGAFTVNLGSFPRIVMASVTSPNGSSSEFISKTVDYGLVFTPSYSSTTLYLPGDVITYTHYLTNTGSISDVINLTRSSSAGWTSVVSPSSVALAPDQGTTVDVILTVPPAGQPNSLAGVIDTTTVTATRSITTTGAVTVTDRTGLRGEGRFTLETGSVQEVRAGQRARFAPRLTNVGNLTTTVAVSATTDRESWTTTIDRESIVIAPGQSLNLGIAVLVPNGTQAGVTGTTIISVSAPLFPGGPTQVLTNSNVTRVVVTPRAEIDPDDGGEQDGEAKLVTTFRHTLRYNGNGPATLELRARSNLAGYNIEFVSITPGRPLIGNKITLSNTVEANSMEFEVRIQVPATARIGDRQTTTLEVLADDGTILDTAVDRVRVVRGLPPIARFFPLIARNGN